jgi:hypothetical protein
MKRITHHRDATDNVLHIEAEGVLVNITVGLSDADGREVTRVDISPDDVTRGGDGEGRTWVRDGARIVRLNQGEAPDAVHRKAIETAARDLLALLDQVVPASTIHWAVEGAREQLTSLAAQAKNLHLSTTPRGGVEQPEG